jgi:uncharacterized phiE125 gp8 family phage protein
MRTVVTPPAVEPLTVSDVLEHLRLDESNQEPPPSAITAALAATPAAGNVEAGAHRYLATFVTADGETQAGTASDAVTVVDAGVNGQIELTAIPIGGNLVTSRKLYRTIAGGSTYYLLDTLADNTTVIYTDNIADGSLGAEAPLTNSTLDPMIGRFITTARQMAEQHLKRYLITQTVDAYFDDFVSNRTIYLPPLASVTSIKYIDTDGVEQTLSASNYLVDAISRPAQIEEAYGMSWPSVRSQRNAVVVRFVAGYGDAATDVPACIKDWMLFHINTMWETRTQFTISTGRAALTQIPNDYIDAMLDPERVTGRI